MLDEPIRAYVRLRSRKSSEARIRARIMELFTIPIENARFRLASFRQWFRSCLHAITDSERNRLFAHFTRYGIKI